MIRGFESGLAHLKARRDDHLPPLACDRLWRSGRIDGGYQEMIHLASINERPSLVSKPLDACRACNIPGSEPLVAQDNFGFSVPSLGALVEGWVLVFPRRHVLALNQLSDLEWSEFNRHAELTRQMVKVAYGEFIQFEHGSAGVGRTAACGVDHAHLHIVALSIDLREAIHHIEHEVGAFDWEPVAGRVPMGVASDYIWVQDATGQWMAQADVLPSQVVRRAIAAAIECDEWDWKLAHRRELMLRTSERLIGARQS